MNNEINSGMSSQSKRMLNFAVSIWLVFCFNPDRCSASDSSQLGDTDLESLLTTIRSNACTEYQFNAQRLIPSLFERNQIDSVKAIIEFVRRRCSATSFSSLTTLMNIENGTFDDSQCDTAIINDVLDIGYGRYYRWDCFGSRSWEFADTSFSSFIRSYAFHLASETRPQSFSNFVTLYYAGKKNALLTSLEHGEYSTTCVLEKYNDLVDSLRNEWKKFRSHAGLNLGAWLTKRSQSAPWRETGNGWTTWRPVRKVGC